MATSRPKSKSVKKKKPLVAKKERVPVPPASSNIYTISADQPFIESLARGILDRTGGDPLKLADYTILVPDRPTGSLLRQEITRQLQGKPFIMPKIDTPGDMGDENLSLKISGSPILSQTLMDMPPPVSRLHRQLILAQEILKIPGMASSAQKAIKLGGELGRFLDEAQRYSVDLSRIDSHVPPQFKDQWARTAEFLKIVTEIWPKHLEKMGMVDPEDHKNAVIQIQAAHWLQNPPQTPVIAAGFTETAPSMTQLLAAVRSLPQGAVVIPGADLAMDDKSWDVMTEVHPQHFIKKFLSAMQVPRKSVTAWSSPTSEKTPLARQHLLREALRPSGTAEGWGELIATRKDKTKTAAIDVAALEGLELQTCATQQEEASVIALKLRETLEKQGGSAALVTEDRSLARRVSARLRYWKIHVEDGAGVSLAETPTGIYLLAAARMAADEMAPVSFLEALKHPLTALGEDREGFREKLSMLENVIFHGPRPAPGMAGIKTSLTAAFNRQARKEDKAALEAWADRIEQAGGDFFKKMAAPAPQPFKELLDEHIRFAEILATDSKEKGAERLWRGDDGVKATRFLTQLREAAVFVPPLTGREYVDVLQGLMRDVNVRSNYTSHPAIQILTPAQAYLARPNNVILGGLNDEVWPRPADENPWLSPDMMKALGLPPPEESLGRSAHRFYLLASSPEALLSRAVRSGDAPTVASPLLTRLMMVLTGSGLDDDIGRKPSLLGIHTAMHVPDAITPVEPPMPTPAAALRPKQLPVTAIETLMRDPYTVYAKYILKLRPKEPIDASPTAAERGIFTHAALEVFVKKYPDQLPDNAYEELLKIGAETFKTRINNPSVQAFWWPRFERIAKHFVKFENERRELCHTLGTEVRGRMELDIEGEKFTLTAIADRIDADVDDNIEIIDYKTGSVPSQKSVSYGFSPQLTLEAVIALSKGFDNIEPKPVTRLQYWRLSGGRPAMEDIEVKGDVAKLIEEARTGITELVKTFNKAATPYLVTPRPEWAPRYNNYEHLSRVGEWSTVKKSGGKHQQKTSRRAAGSKGGVK